MSDKITPEVAIKILELARDKYLWNGKEQREANIGLNKEFACHAVVAAQLEILDNYDFRGPIQKVIIEHIDGQGSAKDYFRDQGWTGTTVELQAKRVELINDVIQYYKELA